MALIPPDRGARVAATAASIDSVIDAAVSVADGWITIDGRPAFLVPGARDWLRYEAPTVWPNVMGGEHRPAMLFGIVQDAGNPTGDRLDDSDLSEALLDGLPGSTPEQREQLADAARAKFWQSVDRHRDYLIPLHADLASGFRQHGTVKGPYRYKMVRGSILPFLCQDAAGDVDTELLERFLELFRSEDDLTILDREVLRIARSLAPEGTLSIDTLMASSQAALDNARAAGGPFCPASLASFRRDLGSVLGAGLPRRDLLNQVTLVVALHLALRLYRTGVVLSRQIDALVAQSMGVQREGDVGCAGGCCGDLGQCDLAGSLRFRVGSGSFRSVRLADPSVRSYREMTSTYLLPLSVSIATGYFAIAALDAARASLDGAATVPAVIPARLLADMPDALAGGSALLRARFDAILRLLALARYDETRGATTADELAGLARPSEPGIHVLRQALLESRRTTMRHIGRDAVHQLLKEARPGRLIASNGTRATFFEIDEAMIFLLVTVICQDRPLPMQRFLERLRDYGLEPQDAAEEGRLRSSLARLGMLSRYSDAAESAYVHRASVNEDAQ